MWWLPSTLTFNPATVNYCQLSFDEADLVDLDALASYVDGSIDPRLGLWNCSRVRSPAVDWPPFPSMGRRGLKLSHMIVMG